MLTARRNAQPTRIGKLDINGSALRGNGRLWLNTRQGKPIIRFPDDHFDHSESVEPGRSMRWH
jgi:hypothetical protein